MNAFQSLLCMIKIAAQNTRTLHRNLERDTAWFANHEQLGDYYAMFDDMEDDLSEIGISIGVKEPTISEASDKIDVITTDGRDARTSYQLVKSWMVDIADTMQVISSNMDDSQRYISNKLDEYQYNLRKEAEFKLERATRG